MEKINLVLELSRFLNLLTNLVTSNFFTILSRVHMKINAYIYTILKRRIAEWFKTTDKTTQNCDIVIIIDNALHLCLSRDYPLWSLQLPWHQNEWLFVNMTISFQMPLLFVEIAFPCYFALEFVDFSVLSILRRLLLWNASSDSELFFEPRWYSCSIFLMT